MGARAEFRATSPTEDGVYARVPGGGEATGSAVVAVQAASSGAHAHAVKIDSRNGDAPALLVRGTGSLIAAYDDAGDVVFEVDQSGISVGGGSGGLAATLADAKGDLLAATAADTFARLAAGSDGQALVANSDATAGLAYVSPAVLHPAPLTHYGLRAASGHPADFLGNSGVTNGQVFLGRVWIPAGQAITNLWLAVRGAGTHDGTTTPNQLALYTDAGVQVDTTADDATLFAAAGWRGGALSGGAVAAQATGRWVYIGHIARGWTGGTIAFPADADDNHATWFATGPGGGNRRAMYQTGQTALPASFTPTTHGTATTFLPLYGVT